MTPFPIEYIDTENHRNEVWSLIISDCMLRTPYHAETVKQMGEDKAKEVTLNFAGKSRDVAKIGLHMERMVEGMTWDERMAFYRIARNWCLDEFDGTPEDEIVFPGGRVLSQGG